MKIKLGTRHNQVKKALTYYDKERRVFKNPLRPIVNMENNIEGDEWIPETYNDKRCRKFPNM